MALILFGVRFLRKSLDRLFGSNLVSWLQSLTRTPLRAFAGGCAISCIAPSSTTMALLTLDMLRTGRVPPQRLLAVILGANVGITITVQLLSFNLYHYAAVFLAVGLIGFQFLRRDLFRGLGQLLLSLGFIFLAMEMISNAAAGVSGSADVVDSIAILSKHPVLLTLLAAGLALTLQSSTAVIGLAMALAEGGLGGPLAVVAVVLGANLGTAGTVVFSGWSELALRRTAMANLILKAIPVTAILATSPLWSPWLTDQDWSPALLGANLHTGLNLVVGAVGLLSLTPITRLTEFLFAEPPTPIRPPSLPTTFLDPQTLPIPALALAHAGRETLVMADTVQAMLIGHSNAQAQRNPQLARGIRVQDDEVDLLNTEIKKFLSQITQESLNPAETQTLFSLLTIANELEAIGDIIDKNLCDHLIKQIDGHFSAPSADQNDLERLKLDLLGRFRLGVALLATKDPKDAAAFIAEKAAFDQACVRAQKEHFARIVTADRATLEASAFFLDGLISYRRINGHLTNLAHACHHATE
ncbi:MAG: Na/Pi symporter [Chthoniobacterales bacterium]